MTRQTADCLYNAAKIIPYFFIEDIYFTGLVAAMCNVEVTHHPGIRYRPLKGYVGHTKNLEQMDQLFRVVLDDIKS